MHQVSKIKLRKRGLDITSFDDANEQFATKKEYKKALKKWQKKLLQVQQAYYHQGLRALLVFEGWDAAGKGGAIRRITQRLDPRGVQVYPIAAPNEVEQSKHYLYRFWNKIPQAGCWSIFDRSHYGRVLVERIEGFASEQQWQRAYQEINEFERQLTDDGVRVIKFFVHIDDATQLARFEARLDDPQKRWKLTEEDIRNRQQRGEYEAAVPFYDEALAGLTPDERATLLSLIETVVKNLSGDDPGVPAPISGSPESKSQ